MLGEALELFLLLATIAINILDPVLQFANGVDLCFEAARTSPIEVILLAGPKRTGLLEDLNPKCLKLL